MQSISPTTTSMISPIQAGRRNASHAPRQGTGPAHAFVQASVKNEDNRDDAALLSAPHSNRAQSSTAGPSFSIRPTVVDLTLEDTSDTDDDMPIFVSEKLTTTRQPSAGRRSVKTERIDDEEISSRVLSKKRQRAAQPSQTTVEQQAAVQRPTSTGPSALASSSTAPAAAQPQPVPSLAPSFQTTRITPTARQAATTLDRPFGIKAEAHAAELPMSSVRPQSSSAVPLNPTTSTTTTGHTAIGNGLSPSNRANSLASGNIGSPSISPISRRISRIKLTLPRRPQRLSSSSSDLTSLSEASDEEPSRPPAATSVRVRVRMRAPLSVQRQRVQNAAARTQLVQAEAVQPIPAPPTIPPPPPPRAAPPPPPPPPPVVQPFAAEATEDAKPPRPQNARAGPVPLRRYDPQDDDADFSFWSYGGAHAGSEHEEAANGSVRIESSQSAARETEDDKSHLRLLKSTSISNAKPGLPTSPARAKAEMLQDANDELLRSAPRAPGSTRRTIRTNLARSRREIELDRDRGEGSSTGRGSAVGSIPRTPAAPTSGRSSSPSSARRQHTRFRMAAKREMDSTDPFASQSSQARHVDRAQRDYGQQEHQDGHDSDLSEMSRRDAFARPSIGLRRQFDRTQSDPRPFSMGRIRKLTVAGRQFQEERQRATSSSPAKRQRKRRNVPYEDLEDGGTYTPKRGFPGAEGRARRRGKPKSRGWSHPRNRGGNHVGSAADLPAAALAEFMSSTSEDDDEDDEVGGDPNDPDREWESANGVYGTIKTNFPVAQMFPEVIGSYDLDKLKKDAKEKRPVNSLSDIFKPGDLIYGKVKGFRPWPAVVVDCSTMPHCIQDLMPVDSVTEVAFRFIPEGNYFKGTAETIQPLSREALLADLRGLSLALGTSVGIHRPRRPMNLEEQLMEGLRVALSPVALKVWCAKMDKVTRASNRKYGPPRNWKAVRDATIQQRRMQEAREQVKKWAKPGPGHDSALLLQHEPTFNLVPDTDARLLHDDGLFYAVISICSEYPCLSSIFVELPRRPKTLLARFKDGSTIEPGLVPRRRPLPRSRYEKHAETNIQAELDGIPLGSRTIRNVVRRPAAPPGTVDPFLLRGTANEGMSNRSKGKQRARPEPPPPPPYGHQQMGTTTMAAGSSSATTAAAAVPNGAVAPADDDADMDGAPYEDLMTRVLSSGASRPALSGADAWLGQSPARGSSHAGSDSTLVAESAVHHPGSAAGLSSSLPSNFFNPSGGFGRRADPPGYSATPPSTGLNVDLDGGDLLESYFAETDRQKRKKKVAGAANEDDVAVDEADEEEDEEIETFLHQREATGAWSTSYGPGGFTPMGPYAMSRGADTPELSDVEDRYQGVGGGSITYFSSGTGLGAMTPNFYSNNGSRTPGWTSRAASVFNDMDEDDG
ncbi:hypothetical protein OC846_001030 [Tilletia horrida]|uniref:PWWP domain-containing protein n=1 Tax=Tilletia horrida TaxID=155126 RepID=A0AAN6JTC3_9BASI|nr:hypothetical protein OC846_001030 [Tilletia horrida]